MPEVMGEEYSGKATAPELTLDPVVAGQAFCERGEVSHPEMSKIAAIIPAAGRGVNDGADVRPKTMPNRRCSILLSVRRHPILDHADAIGADGPGKQEALTVRRGDERLTQ